LYLQNILKSPICASVKIKTCFSFLFKAPELIPTPNVLTALPLPMLVYLNTNHTKITPKIPLDHTIQIFFPCGILASQSPCIRLVYGTTFLPCGIIRNTSFGGGDSAQTWRRLRRLNT